jgi:hypothetical protein
VIGALIGACEAPVFLCDEDGDCVDGRSDGVCELDGYCSFVDTECPTGRAYGELAPHGLARRCTMPVDELGSTGDDGGSSSSDDGGDDGTTRNPVAPHRDGDDESSGSTTAPFDDTCDNGMRDDDEADIDCGGSCSPCELCRACSDDDDCIDGATCVGGSCRVLTSFTTDWKTDCSEAGEFETSVTVPPGVYQLSALSSAGSKWIDDSINGGNTWAWWLDCKEVAVTDMRTPVGHWYAVPADAFAALVYPAQAVVLDTGTLSCGVIDNVCTDNRGGVEVALENICP